MKEPKDKAAELVEKFYDIDDCPEHYDDPRICNHLAIKCAKIAVDEIIANAPLYPNDVDWDDCGGTHKYYYETQRFEAESYWQQVRLELDNL